MKLEPGFRDITAEELVEYLLRESGQAQDDAVNPLPILELLRLSHLSADFDRELPEVVTPEHDRPRALLAFEERIIATDANLTPTRARFSTFHEIAHYVIPEHLEAIVLCSERDMSQFASSQRERQANDFAAGLLFHGTRFSLEVNSRTISAATVKELAEKYDASFEATARRLVERNLRPCLLVVYGEVPSDQRISPTRRKRWDVRYTAASPTFALRYFSHVQRDPDNPNVIQVAVRGRDIADVVYVEEAIQLPDGRICRFGMEYFFNGYSAFSLVQPLDEHRGR